MFEIYKWESLYKQFPFVKEDLKQMAYYTMGILYLRGLMRQVLFGSKTIWYHELSNDIFADTEVWIFFPLSVGSSNLMTRRKRMNTGNLINLNVFEIFLRRRLTIMHVTDKPIYIVQQMKRCTQTKVTLISSRLITQSQKIWSSVPIHL